MRIIKELKFVEGEGLEKLMNYQRKIEVKKEDVEGTTRAFNRIKEQILDERYTDAKNGLEELFLEVIPNEFEYKLKNINKSEVTKIVDIWLKEYLQIAEAGFHMIIMQKM